MGLLDEVADLSEKGLLKNRSAANAIGYRQGLLYHNSEKSEEDYKKFVHDFKKASRHYVKRQFTWFRHRPEFNWLDVDIHDTEIAADMIMHEFLSW